MSYEVIGKMLSSPVQSAAAMAAVGAFANYLRGWRIKGDDKGAITEYTKAGAYSGVCVGVLASACVTQDWRALGAAVGGALASCYWNNYDFYRYDGKLIDDKAALAYAVGRVASYGAFALAALYSNVPSNAQLNAQLIMANPIQSAATAAALFAIVNYIRGCFVEPEHERISKAEIRAEHANTGAYFGAFIGVLASACVTRDSRALGAAAFGALAACYWNHDELLNSRGLDLSLKKIMCADGFGAFIGAALCSSIIGPALEL